MKKKISFVAIFTICITSISQQSILDDYINLALESNLALQQKQSSYEKSIQALKEARGMFFPNISFNARYTVAEGGRTIEFPVGDMLNPVYLNLNALNQINGIINPATGQIVQYPMIENQEFQFYRPNEHETKIRLVQPILNNQVYFNNKIKKDLVNVEKSGFDAYQRQLVFEVKSAYFQYLQTNEVLELLEATKELLDENLRVNQKLFENDLITKDNIYRSESELNKLMQLKAEAFKNNQMAKSYFNFLLNRDLESEITIDTTINTNKNTFLIKDLQYKAISEREELHQLEYYLNVNKNITKLNQSNALPTITGIVDYGYQGEEYKFTNEYDYVLGSVVLQWDLFKGLQNKRKIEQSKIDEDILRNKLDEVKQQINLQIVNSYYDLEAALKAIEAAESIVNTTNKAFDIVRKKFNQGQSPLIEYIDARTSYTNARQNLIISNYNYQLKYAEFERIACLYNPNKYK